MPIQMDQPARSGVKQLGEYLPALQERRHYDRMPSGSSVGKRTL